MKDKSSEIKSIVLVCCIVDKSYGMWCSVEKRMQFEELDMKLCLGSFYKVEVSFIILKKFKKNF